MVTQYPHTINVNTAGASTQNASGNWVTGPPTVMMKECRAEPNSSNGKVKSADGTLIDFSWIIYLPLPVDTLAVGSKVIVTSGAETLLTDTIKRFSRGQLNARIWL